MMITICNLLWRGDRQRLVCDEMILVYSHIVQFQWPAIEGKGEEDSSWCPTVAAQQQQKKRKLASLWGDDRVDGGLKSR